MQNKFNLKNLFVVFVAVFLWSINPLFAESELIVDEYAEDFIEEDYDDGSDDLQRQASADAVSKYQVEGSLFEQITTLEQEKILMQLEKERAQLDLELDKLAAEKIKLHMEIDTLSGRAEQQQQEFETEKAKLAAEVARLAREKEALNTESVFETKSVSKVTYDNANEKSTKITETYKLVNVYGAGNQLQATVSDLSTGQTKRLGVGKTLDGYTVKSISLDEGIVFVKDGATETLNVSNR